MLTWVYHGKNRKQCYNNPHCLTCFIKTFFLILRLSSTQQKMRKGYVLRNFKHNLIAFRQKVVLKTIAGPPSRYQDFHAMVLKEVRGLMKELEEQLKNVEELGGSMGERMLIHQILGDCPEEKGVTKNEVS